MQPSSDGRSKGTGMRTKFKARRLLVAAAIAAAVAGGVLGAATPASAASRLGGIDMGRVCSTQNGSSWWVPYLVAQNAYGWRCWNDQIRQSRTIDLNWGCRILYGAGAWASTSNSNSPYAWSCYR